MSEIGSLGALFLSSFLAATLLPGGSEAAFLLMLELHPEARWWALALATVGNTLGGLTSYGMARLLPERVTRQFQERHLALLRRWGAAGLILGWVPLIGDLLCVAAGWLRLPWLQCALWLALGKGLRYAALLAGWQWWVG